MERLGAVPTKPLVVAVSGGPDSLALLHALHQVREGVATRLHGAHLDHGIRGAESASDAEFVAEAFRDLGIEGTVSRADVPAFARRRRLSMEEAAREVRLDFLAEVARQQGAYGVALGHTSDDQVETVLMRILRGTGTGGLRGMRPVSRRNAPGGEVTLLRPLLDVGRSETEAYCRELGLQPRLDSTNLSPEMTRNRVRLELLPLLEKFNPSVREGLLRLSRSADRETAYLEQQTDALWEKIAGHDGRRVILQRDATSRLPAALLNAILRRAVREVRGSLRDLGQVHVDTMARLVGGPAGRSLDLPGGLLFSVGYSQISLGLDGEEEDTLPPPLAGCHPIAVPGVTELAGWTVSARVVEDGRPQGQAGTNGGRLEAFPEDAGALVDYRGVGGQLHVRSRRDGDRFQPLGMSQTKKLQDFMVDSKVPRAWRDRIPLLVSSKGIAWVVGWRVSEWAKARGDGSPSLEVRFRRR